MFLSAGLHNETHLRFYERLDITDVINLSYKSVYIQVFREITAVLEIEAVKR